VNCKQAFALPIFSGASFLGDTLPHNGVSSRGHYSRSIKSAQIQPFARFAPFKSSRFNTSEKSRCNSSRINTFAKSSFFIKSLIINDFKSIRITRRDNKPCIINTSETFVSKPFRINTSENTPGGGAAGDAPGVQTGRTGEPAASAPRNATATT